APAPGPGSDGDERRTPRARRSPTWRKRCSQTEVRLLVLRLAGVEIAQLVLQVVAEAVAVVALEVAQALDGLVELGLLLLESGEGRAGLLLGLADDALVLVVGLGDEAVALVLALLDVLVVQTVGQGDDAGGGLVRGLLGGGLRRGLRGGGLLRGGNGLALVGDLSLRLRGFGTLGDHSGVDDRGGLAGRGGVDGRGRGGGAGLELGDAVVRLLELLLQALVLGDQFLETRFDVVVEEVVDLVHVVALGEPNGGEPLILQVFGHQSHGSPFPSDYVRSAVGAMPTSVADAAGVPEPVRVTSPDRRAPAAGSSRGRAGASRSGRGRPRRCAGAG